MKGYLSTFTKILVFKGRATRAELWGYIFFTFLFMILSILIDMLLGIHILFIAFPVVAFFPGLSLTVRRLHDISMSGFYVLILPLVPAAAIAAAAVASGLKRGSDNNLQVALVSAGLVCILFEVFISAMPSTNRANKYGDLPGVMSVMADDDGLM